MQVTKADPFGLSAGELVSFMKRISPVELPFYLDRGGIETLNLSIKDVQALIEPILQGVQVDEASKRLADRIKKSGITFPFERFDDARFQAIIKKLCESGTSPTTYAKAADADSVVVIGSCDMDQGRSHLLIDGKRWGANHNYGTMWRLFSHAQDKVAVILNPTGADAPGRFIDGCTHERLRSSVVSTGYTSPVEGWEKSLELVCKRVVGRLFDTYKSYYEQEVPIPYKAVSDHHFRSACIELFPCSFHFPPTSLHATLAFLSTRSQNVFQAGCRMLDPSAGHGHRLAAALSCPKITFMQATDPNSAMMEGYKNIFTVMQRHVSGMDASLDIIADAPLHIGEGSRTFRIIQGKAEDPQNPIYRVDRAYTLVFSSPPFFDTEAYSTPDGQSIQSFTSFELWRDGFLVPMLQNCWNVLAPEGYMAINLTDTQNHKVVEALIHAVTQTLHGSYLGVIPSRKAIGASRWTKQDEQEVVIEHGIDPIWIFQK